MAIKIKVTPNQNKIKVSLKDITAIHYESGKEPQTKSVEYVENGEYIVKPGEGYVLNKVEIKVDVPIPEGYLKPEGTLEVNQEGTYNVTEYSGANFSVQKEKASVVPTEESQVLTPGVNKYL